jgi:hypothetical protein
LVNAGNGVTSGIGFGAGIGSNIEISVKVTPGSSWEVKLGLIIV